jgi:isocitrate/isopropylmalate dehydrogenase
LDYYSHIIRNAIVKTIDDNNVKTSDLGGTHSTTEFMKVILDEIQRNTPETGKMN